MYFFDMMDYVNTNVIGCNNEDVRLNGDWGDLAITANSTKGSFFLAANQWYIATKANLNPALCQEFDTYWTDFQSYQTDPRWTTFWDVASNTQMNSLTREIWEDYLTLMGETMCKLKQLMIYYDGDTFEAFYP